MILQQINWKVIGIWPFYDWLISGLYILIINGLKDPSVYYKTAANDAEKLEKMSSRLLFLLLLYPSSTQDDNTESYPLLYFKPCDIFVFSL